MRWACTSGKFSLIPATVLAVAGIIAVSSVGCGGQKANSQVSILELIRADQISEKDIPEASIDPRLTKAIQAQTKIPSVAGQTGYKAEFTQSGKPFTVWAWKTNDSVCVAVTYPVAHFSYGCDTTRSLVGGDMFVMEIGDKLRWNGFDQWTVGVLPPRATKTRTLDGRAQRANCLIQSIFYSCLTSNASSIRFLDRSGVEVDSIDVPAP